MTSVRGRGYLRRERLFVASLNSFPSPESEFSKQPIRPSGPKPPTAATDVPKYSENDLQQIFRTVLEAQTLVPTPASAPALAASKKSQDKLLKTRSMNIYCGKSQIDYYNFC